MKNFVIVLVVVAILGGGAWFALQKKGGGAMTKKEDTSHVFKVGIIYKGDNFKQVVDGFKAGLDGALTAKNRKAEYLIENVSGAEQADFDAAAQKLIDEKVEIILAVAVEGVTAAKKLTAENKIPVLLAIGANPANLKFVDNFQTPGGNITGVTWQVEELSGKRIEILKQIDPRVKKLVLFRKKGTKAIEGSLVHINKAVKNLGLTLTIKEVENEAELESVASKLSRSEIDGITYASDPFIARNIGIILKYAEKAKIPGMYADESAVHKGGLASYGGNFGAAGEQVSHLAVKILLNKESPANLPVEAVSKIDLALNLVVAKNIGLTIPADVLSLAQVTISQ